MIRRVDWSDVTETCGFQDVICREHICGAGTWIDILSRISGGTFHKKCGPVPGAKSLDAQISGCTMLIGTVKKLVAKSPFASCMLRSNALYASRSSRRPTPMRRSVDVLWFGCAYSEAEGRVLNCLACIDPGGGSWFGRLQSR